MNLKAESLSNQPGQASKYSGYEHAWLGIDPGQNGAACLLTGNDIAMFIDWDEIFPPRPS